MNVGKNQNYHNMSSQDLMLAFKDVWAFWCLICSNPSEKISLAVFHRWEPSVKLQQNDKETVDRLRQYGTDWNRSSVKGPSGTRAADGPVFQRMDLEPNTAVWFQRFGTTTDTSDYRLTIKEALHIKHQKVHTSLNTNIKSCELILW